MHFFVHMEASRIHTVIVHIQRLSNKSHRIASGFLIQKCIGLLFICQSFKNSISLTIQQCDWWPNGHLYFFSCFRDAAGQSNIAGEMENSNYFVIKRQIAFDGQCEQKDEQAKRREQANHKETGIQWNTDWAKCHKIRSLNRIYALGCSTYVTMRTAARRSFDFVDGCRLTFVWAIS